MRQRFLIIVAIALSTVSAVRAQQFYGGLILNEYNAVSSANLTGQSAAVRAQEGVRSLFERRL